VQRKSPGPPPAASEPHTPNLPVRHHSVAGFIARLEIFRQLPPTSSLMPYLPFHRDHFIVVSRISFALARAAFGEFF